MKHLASNRFWICRAALPEDIRTLADKNYDLLKNNPRHPSLHFKKCRQGVVSSNRCPSPRIATKIEGSGFQLDRMPSMTNLLPNPAFERDATERQLIPAVRKFAEMGVETGKLIEAQEPLEKQPRMI